MLHPQVLWNTLATTKIHKTVLSPCFPIVFLQSFYYFHLVQPMPTGRHAKERSCLSSGTSSSRAWPSSVCSQESSWTILVKHPCIFNRLVYCTWISHVLPMKYLRGTVNATLFLAQGRNFIQFHSGHIRARRTFASAQMSVCVCIYIYIYPVSLKCKFTEFICKIHFVLKKLVYL